MNKFQWTFNQTTEVFFRENELKMSSAKCRLFRWDLHELNNNMNYIINHVKKYGCLEDPTLWVLSHDDVMKWKHFLRYWPFVRGIHRSPVNSPHKGRWRGALMFPLICARINSWVNNGEAGDLTHHRAYYDASVMQFMKTSSSETLPTLVTDGLRSQKVSNKQFWCFVNLNKLWNKQSNPPWSETLRCSCDVAVIGGMYFLGLGRWVQSIYGVRIVQFLGFINPYC